MVRVMGEWRGRVIQHERERAVSASVIANTDI